MRSIFILAYMLLFHPVVFIKYTIRKKSKFFLMNGVHQKISTKKLIIGKDVRIGDYTRIDFYGKGCLKIGNGCYFGQRNSFLIGEDISIADNVLIASDVLITSENHNMDPNNSACYGKQPLIFAPVRIANGCWIGEKAIILPGVSIGEKAVIGAGSVVTKDIPDFSIAVGNPAKVIKRFDFNTGKWEKC